MKKVRFTIEKDGLYGCYYPIDNSDFAFIALTGDDCQDLLAKTVAKWFHKLGINVFAMSPNKHDYSHHSFPLERFETVIKYLHDQGINKIGIIGMSTTAMLALVAASYFHQISLTIVISPSDFVMEGFYQEKGIERPGNNESSISYKGEDLPYLPFAYRHPDYWNHIKQESKTTHNQIASRALFDESERLTPISEDLRIKVENILGTILFIGAKDDALWDTCKYIKRMQQVLLNVMKKGANARFLTYEHGTHFLLPESLLKMFYVPTSLIPAIAFKAGRDFKKECKASRIDVDNNIKDAIDVWKKITLVPDCAKMKDEILEHLK